MRARTFNDTNISKQTWLAAQLTIFRVIQHVGCPVPLQKCVKKCIIQIYPIAPTYNPAITKETCPRTTGEQLLIHTYTKPHYFCLPADSCECDTITSVTQTIPSPPDERICSSLELLPSRPGYVAVVVVSYADWYVSGPFLCVWVSPSKFPLGSVCGLDWFCRDRERNLYRVPRE
jgi:hypothetical protein